MVQNPEPVHLILPTSEFVVVITTLSFKYLYVGHSQSKKQ